MKICKIVSLFLISISITTICTAQNSSAKLQEIIGTVQDHKSYEREDFPLGLYTKDHYKKEAEFAKEQLDKLTIINKDSLNKSEKISAELMKFKLEEMVDFYEYEAYLNPILSDAGFHVSLPYHVRDLANYGQVKNYLNKLNAVPVYVDQHLALLREGISKGITQPKVIFKGYEATYNDQIVDDYKESYYYSPFTDLPPTLTAAQKDSVLYAAEKAIQNNIIPEFKNTSDALIFPKYF